MQALLHGLQRRLLALLGVSYVLGALFPSAGLWIRSHHLARVGSFYVTWQWLMLGFLLFNAGIGVTARDLRRLVRHPGLLPVALVANSLVPLTGILLTPTVLHWHNGAELETALVGFAIVGAMPIAASCTAWTRNREGNLALAVGLVVISTLASPVLTPAVLGLAAHALDAPHAARVQSLAHGGCVSFLFLSALVPSALGVGARNLLGEARAATWGPPLKVLNLANLLALNYANASLALPKALGEPDWDYLALIFALAFGLCIAAFAAGYAVGSVMHVDGADRTTLMFALGMNNNGSGLVLASAGLAEHPHVLLPILVYNIAQQLVAGVVDYLLLRASVRRRSGAGEELAAVGAGVDPPPEPTYSAGSRS
jgi:BASS family bile acid:Na+ symporter